MTRLEQQHLPVQVPFKQRYDNYIGGRWVPPVNGRYFENITPITGKPFCEISIMRNRTVIFHSGTGRACRFSGLVAMCINRWGGLVLNCYFEATG